VDCDDCWHHAALENKKKLPLYFATCPAPPLMSVLVVVVDVVVVVVVGVPITLLYFVFVY
jgi:hypothetical protein